MASFETLHKRVGGRVVRMVHLQDLADRAGEDPAAINGLMIECLRDGLWPEPFLRNAGCLSANEQAALLRSHVAIFGLGGLGGHLAVLLARAGVGHMALADGDAFDPTNLNRQALCFTENLGENKAAAAAWQVGLANPAVTVTVWEEAMTEENAADILCGADLALDGLDTVTARKVLYGEAMALDVPLIHGAVSGFSGHATTFLPNEPPTLEDVYQNARDHGGPPSVLSPAVATVAAIQASEAVRVLCGRGPALHGRLVHFDGENLKMGSAKL